MFQIFGILIWILFYGIYLGKMLIQRRKGIQTDQIAKGKKKGKLFWTEVFMKIATYLAVLVQGISIVENISVLPAFFRKVGVVVGFGGVLIFAVSVYTMRDSWRAGIPETDQIEFVETGIYKFSRNPAFLGFDLHYLGLLFMFFHPFLLICSCFAVIMLHLQILQEEYYLEKIFGETYCNYKRSVGRYLGRKER